MFNGKVNKLRNLIPGTIYNKLTVIEYTHVKSIPRSDRPGQFSYFYFYDFKCECGNIRNINAASVVNNTTKSCGCNQIINGNIQVQKLIKYHKYKALSTDNVEGAIKRIYSSYKTAAKKRNFDFQINYNIFKEIINKKCYYCKSEPSNKSQSKNKKASYLYNGIDRINSQQGYIIENVRPCCFICNQMKSDLLESDFKEHITKLYNLYING